MKFSGTRATATLGALSLTNDSSSLKTGRSRIGLVPPERSDFTLRKTFSHRGGTAFDAPGDLSERCL